MNFTNNKSLLCISIWMIWTHYKIFEQSNIFRLRMSSNPRSIIYKGDCSCTQYKGRVQEQNPNFKILVSSCYRPSVWLTSFDWFVLLFFIFILFNFRLLHFTSSGELWVILLNIIPIWGQSTHFGAKSTIPAIDTRVFMLTIIVLVYQFVLFSLTWWSNGEWTRLPTEGSRVESL